MTENEPEIRFKPLDRGLGFHPFEDGLPYTSNLKNPPVMPARPVRSPPQATKPDLSPASRSDVWAKTKKDSSPTRLEKTLPESYTRNTSFFRGSIAYLLDLSIHFVLFAFFFGGVVQRMGLSWRIFIDDGAWPLTLAFFFGLHCVFHVGQLFAFRTSIGRKILGIPRR